jgi:hypothetical protein
MARRLLALLTLAALAACSSTGSSRGSWYGGASGGSSVAAPSAAPPAPRMEPQRKVADQDCSRPLAVAEGNLRCR